MKRRRKSARRKSAREEEERGAPAKAVFHSPFKDLPKLVREVRAAMPPATERKPVAAAPITPARPEPDEAALLRQALDGVRPLSARRIAKIAAEPPVTHTVVSEEAEVLAELSDLVSGQRPFELTETDEYVEGARVGIDPRVVTRLRRGEFALQGHIDLHGMTRGDAKAALETFIIDSARKGRRAILVVHGRGLGSPGGMPVLKHATAQWLSHGAMGGYVLAFTSARPPDGGAGAMYVLLRRDRRRAPFDILNGAHRG
ncbi:MAG: Smr/MutS family protein [Candidatus Binataceae bacterium]